jgi:hypothetical protein
MEVSQNIPERCETLWVFLCHVLAVFVKQTLKNRQKGGKMKCLSLSTIDYTNLYSDAPAGYLTEL